LSSSDGEDPLSVTGVFPIRTDYSPREDGSKRRKTAGNLSASQQKQQNSGSGRIVYAADGSGQKIRLIPLSGGHLYDDNTPAEGEVTAGTSIVQYSDSEDEEAQVRVKKSRDATGSAPKQKALSKLTTMDVCNSAAAEMYQAKKKSVGVISRMKAAVLLEEGAYWRQRRLNENLQLQSRGLAVAELPPQLAEALSANTEILTASILENMSDGSEDYKRKFFIILPC
jgi:hypothetical protein